MRHDCESVKVADCGNTMDGDMITMFRLTPEKLREQGLQFVTDHDGSIEIRGRYEPVQIFDHEFCKHFARDVGEREADRILDMAGSLVQREVFLNKFRKAIS